MLSLRIVMTTVGTSGDVLPFAALAQGLLRAGHQVRVCSYELHRRSFEDKNIEFRAAGPAVTWEQIKAAGEAAAAVSPAEQVGVLERFHLRSGAAHYQDLLQHTRGFDLGICHSIHSLGQAALMDNHIPWANVILDPSMAPTAFAPPYALPNLGRLGNRLLWQLVERSFASSDRAVNELLANAGSRREDMRIFRTMSPTLNLLACSSHLAPPYPDYPPTFKTTGAWRVFEDVYLASHELQTFLRQGAKPVVVSFGSAYDMPAGGAEGARDISAVVTGALAQIGARAIIQRGASGLSDNNPSEDIYYCGYVPHDFLFARAACVVHHGGAGVSVAACAAGIPSVVVPHIADQFFWAKRLAKLGVAPKPLPLKDLTAGRLADRMHTCLSDQDMRRRAQHLGQKIAREKGVDAAVSHIEKMLLDT